MKLYITSSVGYEGAKAIAEALKINTTLTHMGLQYYYIDAAGINLIIKALQASISRGRIRICDINALSDEQKTHIDGLLREANAQALTVNSKRLEEEFYTYFQDQNAFTSENVTEFMTAYHFTIKAARKKFLSTDLVDALANEPIDLESLKEIWHGIHAEVNTLVTQLDNMHLTKQQPLQPTTPFIFCAAPCHGNMVPMHYALIIHTAQGA